ncbi:hypothetical protein VVR12_03190 [Rothia sp. LK2588]|uniref:hypothetical protein n=1 Tax=Rothia sp. LK2588 TaxID=3114369 RepID=UPI0034CEF9E4
MRKLTNLIQAFDRRRTMNRVLKLLEDNKQWEIDQKILQVKGGKLDPRLDVLINVQSKLFGLATLNEQEKNPRPLEWHEVDAVIRGEIGKVLIGQGAADLTRNRPTLL